MSALMAGLEDGCCEVTECVELLTTEESADLQEEVREAEDYSLRLKDELEKVKKERDKAIAASRGKTYKGEQP